MSTSTEVTKIEKVVHDALETFGAEPGEITREATFEQIDIDSLDLAELSQIVEDEFGVTFKSSDVGQLKTVGDAIDFIVARAR